MDDRSNTDRAHARSRLSPGRVAIIVSASATLATTTAQAQPVRIETRGLAVVLERENPGARRWDERYVPACSEPVCSDLARGVRYRINGPAVSPSAPFALLSGPVLLRVNEASRSANSASLGVLLTGATLVALGLSMITAWPWVRWDAIIPIGGAIAGGGALIAGTGGILLATYTTRVTQIVQDESTVLPAIRVALLRGRF